MIFSNFITGTRPVASDDQRRQGGQQQQATKASEACAAVIGFLDGATGGVASRVRRLRQVSSKQLAINNKPTNHNKQLVSDSLDIHSNGSNSNGGRLQQQQQQQPELIQEGKEVVKGGEWQLKRKYTLSEVQQHSSLDDCWMVIFDKVYNITEFVDEHPGGDFILLEYAGRDATHPFLSSRHGSSAYKMLDKYWIGILVDEELYYSNNSSYCSVYSNLSWRSTPTLEHSDSTQTHPQEDRAEASETIATTTTTITTTSTFDLHNYEQTTTSSTTSSNSGDEDEDEEDTFEDADENTEEEEEDSNNDDDEDQGLGKALKSSQQACRTCSARSHSSSSRPSKDYLSR